MSLRIADPTSEDKYVWLGVHDPDCCDHVHGIWPPGPDGWELECCWGCLDGMRSELMSDVRDRLSDGGDLAVDDVAWHICSAAIDMGVIGSHQAGTRAEAVKVASLLLAEPLLVL